MMTTNKTLIRLKDCENDAMLSAIWTEKPVEFLKMYHFCKENDIPITKDTGINDNCIEGTVEDIAVSFGGTIGKDETLPCVDIYIDKW